MSLPANGSISLSQIISVAKGANTTTRISDWEVRYLLNHLTGRVKFSDAYSKPMAGSANYTVPGRYTFLVPPYQSMSTQVWAAGGGGGGGGANDGFAYGYCGGAGGRGGNSSFGTYTSADGGFPGYNGCDNSNGTPGGAGGLTGGGGSGGYGGGGNGGGSGASGGAGGYSSDDLTYLSSGPIWGNTAIGINKITVTVGAGGSGGYGASDVGSHAAAGTSGENGRVYVIWS
jgi:hypothetical protein